MRAAHLSFLRQSGLFLHQSGKKVSKSSLPVLALTVRLQSYPFCSSLVSPAEPRSWLDHESILSRSGRALTHSRSPRAFKKKTATGRPLFSYTGNSYSHFELFPRSVRPVF